MDKPRLNLKPLPRPPLVRTGLFAFALFWYSALCWWHRRVVMDDPWITFRYARNLLEGHGLVFNPGEAVEGYSNFSSVILSAMGMVAHIDPLSAMRTLSWILGAGAIAALFYGIGPRVEVPEDEKKPLRRWFPALPQAALIIAAAYPFAVWTMGGLETIFQAVLILIVCVATARAWGQPGWTAPVIAGIAVTLSGLTRPEGAMFAALPLLGLLLSRDDEARKRMALVLAIFVSAYALYTGWRLAFFGSLIPNVASAKVGLIQGGGPVEELLKGWRYLWGYFASAPALVLFLAAWQLRHLETIREERPLSFETRLGLLALLAVALQLLFTFVVGGDWMPAARFLVPALPALAVAAALTLRRWPVFVQAVLILFLFAAGALEAKRDPILNWTRWAAKEQGGLLVEPLMETGDYLRRVAPEKALVAATEAGVIPYESGLPFVDMLGLVDKHIASLPGGLHEKWDADYVIEREPRYIVLGVVEAEGVTTGVWAPDRAVLEEPSFDEQYEEIHRIERPMPNAPAYSRLLPGWMVIYERKEAFR